MEQVLTLNLPGFGYEDLYRAERLPELDRAFAAHMETRDADLAATFARYRAQAAFDAAAESELLIAVAGVLEDFIAEVFGVRRECDALGGHAGRSALVWAFKNDFVKRSLQTAGDAQEHDFAAVDACVHAWLGEIDGADCEYAVAQLWRHAADAGDEQRLVTLAAWVRAAVASAAGRAATAGWGSFRFPAKRDFAGLVRTELQPAARGCGVAVKPTARRQRDGFALTDMRYGRGEALDQVHYCKFCHSHQGDYCSKGFPGKGQEKTRSNPLGVPLEGCPLEEKISEANALMRDGHTLGALATIMIDNPLVPATGHRICNDCMKSCIYQKQDPVDMPQIETRILDDVLNLPWGYEIYFLLTRWNPLNRERPYALPYHGTDVLCVGAGPAGFNLSHHLLQAGFGVVGADGLKIEPLPAELIGADGRTPQPVREVAELRESLDDRVMAGFGGVAEYGITVRWDKNFLKIIHLTLARNRHYRLYGGIRFGGTLTIDDAWDYGFEHIALAIGAGRPTIVPVKNHLARGIRQASDFLMGLQLTGAAKRTSLANLQVRLPAVVIGGGLTAIDTATEVQAYYIRQVEKMLERCEALGESAVERMLDVEEAAILQEFLAHGREVRRVRAQAQRLGVAPDFAELIDRWGGVTVAYRRRMGESPAYLRNHEEIEKALEEGIRYAEGLNPREALVDRHGHVRAMAFDGPAGERVELPARAVFMAAGSVPNTSYEREHRETFEMEGRFYAAYGLDGERAAAGDREAVFTSYRKDGRRISFLGDNHPVYSGSVVRAMASGRAGARALVRLFAERIGDSGHAAKWDTLCARLDENLRPRIVAVTRLAEHLVSIAVHAPQASRNWQPGQVYRLQNFETLVARDLGTALQMEGMAVDGVQVDKAQGRINLLINEVGTSSRLAATLAPGDSVILMGPTGTSLPMPMDKTITVIGGHSAVTSMIDGSHAWKAAGNRVLMIAHLADRRRAEALQTLVQEAADEIVWVLDGDEVLDNLRVQDRCFVGDMTAYLRAVAAGDRDTSNWVEITDQFVISDRPEVMDMLVTTFKGELAPRLKPSVHGTAVVNSPMQCMLKEVCAQCLCQHRRGDGPDDAPKTVFSCFNQHQPLFDVDFDNLRLRQRQNALQERIASLWLSHVQSSAPDALAESR
ncbi:hypothetical protein BI364_16790 [Acidihalobacter yilgarnensis]|uniref:FAD/NAD(P)-binding domain-containing protein n=1 Tax=Acidihalobacter yilgarnensis TaxID=2819280 RepID=A0A1D8ISH8_9GAMM|nr:FAD-dependent oxidoreductase [Acidihalobacter yilgarnensis]AOU99363.1 hypothetical protein BI364_16790 [Acidihalobacter yilgarnensis]